MYHDRDSLLCLGYGSASGRSHFKRWARRSMVYHAPRHSKRNDSHHDGFIRCCKEGLLTLHSRHNQASYGFVWSTIFLIVVFCNCAVHPGVIVAFDCIAFAVQFSTVCIDLHELAYWSLGGYGYSSTHNVGRLYGVECLGCSMVLVGR